MKLWKRWAASLALLAFVFAAPSAVADQGPRYHLSRDQVSDTNGKPMPGATLTFTVCGTTTPLDTYSDAGLSSLNTAPVVADSAGRFGDIFLQDQAYRAVLKNSAGTTIFTEECVYKGVTRIRASSLPGVNWPGMLVHNTSDGHLYERKSDDSGWTDRGPVDSVGNVATIADVLTGTDATKFVTPDSLSGLWEKGTDVVISSNNISLPSTGGGLFVVTSATGTINSISSSTAGREILLFFTNEQSIASGSGITTATGATVDAPANSFGRFLRYNSGWYLLAQYQTGSTRNTTLPGATGLVVTNNAGTPNTKIDITADAVVMLDGSNSAIYATAYSCTINLGTTGANGLDTGAQASSTWYSAWTIEKPDGTTGCLGSVSATSPTMPAGYSYKLRVGWMRSGGATTLLRTKQVGNIARYIVTAGSNTTALPQMVAPASSATRVAIAVGAFVPTTAMTLTLVATVLNANNVNMTIAPNNDAGYAAATSITAPTPFAVALASAGGNNASVTLDLLLESTNIYYSSGSAAATNSSINAYGWTDRGNLN